jgi:hypothetical protein
MRACRCRCRADPAPRARAVCHAFPDDAYDTDQIFVALISVAVALPVRTLLLRAFELANERDDDVPEAWLTAPAAPWLPLLFGTDAHRSWHFTGSSPVHSVVRWMALNPGEPPVEPLRDAAVDAALRRCAAPRAPPQDVAAAPSPAHSGSSAAKRNNKALYTSSAGSGASGSSGSDDMSPEEVATLARRRRLLSKAGLVGVLVTWVICSWFIFVRAPTTRACLTPACASDARPRRTRAPALDVRHGNLPTPG